MRGRRRPAYGAGDVFAVTLDDGGFALGLIARMAKGGLTLGYFFGPRRQSLPVLSESPLLTKDSAARVARFGDLHLRNGKWPVVSRLAGFRPDDWPVPAFSKCCHRTVWYDESLAFSHESPASPGDCAVLSKDGLEGAGYAEIMLTRCLSSPSTPNHHRDPQHLDNSGCCPRASWQRQTGS